MLGRTTRCVCASPTDSFGDLVDGTVKSGTIICDCGRDFLSLLPHNFSAPLHRLAWIFEVLVWAKQVREFCHCCVVLGNVLSQPDEYDKPCFLILCTNKILYWYFHNMEIEVTQPLIQCGIIKFTNLLSVELVSTIL